MKQEETYKHPTIQIIQRVVDTDRLRGSHKDEGKYFQRIQNELKRSVKPNMEILLIELIPKQPIVNVSTLECFIHLQGTITPLVIVPPHKTNITVKQMSEICKFLKVKQVFNWEQR